MQQALHREPSLLGGLGLLPEPTRKPIPNKSGSPFSADVLVSNGTDMRSPSTQMAWGERAWDRNDGGRLRGKLEISQNFPSPASRPSPTQAVTVPSAVCPCRQEEMRPLTQGEVMGETPTGQHRCTREKPKRLLDKGFT